MAVKQTDPRSRPPLPLTLCCFLAASGCGSVGEPPTGAIHMNARDLAALQTKTILFGHKSVGDNIVSGLQELMARDPRLQLRIVRSAMPETIADTGFIEFHVGRNGSPQSKNDEFLAILARGAGAQRGIAMLKYCYADINASTDVPGMFDAYRRLVDELKERYPSLRIVHVTIPLTTVEPAPKAWLKSFAGRTTARDLNVKRYHYNELLRRAYGQTDPVFDLAAAESTHPDGSRAYFVRDGVRIETLAPEYTVDGGHLNGLGRAAAAHRLASLLAQL